MLKSVTNRLHYQFKFHPFLIFGISLTFGVSILLFLSMYEIQYRSINVGIKSASDFPYANLKNLVMVAGHSILLGRGCENAQSEKAWFLEPYQKHPGQASSFVEHIKGGVTLAANDESALLLFSGGETRKDAGPRTEAQSYWVVADTSGWFGKEEAVKWRALTEEHARDSFENLLFSVCRFRELTGSYPQNITVVGYDFKEERFSDLHRSAMRFPHSKFFYYGTPTAAESIEGALKGEALVRASFREDPYGCRGTLRRKKLLRNPFYRSIPYPIGCPEIKSLFTYCGSGIFHGPLPWNN